jgi:hypothetical protein
MRTASCRALASTFHLRGCTFLLSLCLADTSKHEYDTHLSDPPDYKVSNFGVVSTWKVGHTGKSIQRLEIRVPRTQRSYRNELIDPFDGASNGCNNFIVIHVSAMSPGNYHVRERDRAREKLTS